MLVVAAAWLASAPALASIPAGVPGADPYLLPAPAAGPLLVAQAQNPVFADGLRNLPVVLGSDGDGRAQSGWPARKAWKESLSYSLVNAPDWIDTGEMAGSRFLTFSIQPCLPSSAST